MCGYNNGLHKRRNDSPLRSRGRERSREDQRKEENKADKTTTTKEKEASHSFITKPKKIKRTCINSYNSSKRQVKTTEEENRTWFLL